MDFSPRLSLPYIAPQQAQKQVTYNEAMRALDTLVQPAVASRTISTPPGSPAEGATYLVPAGAAGDWTGHAQKFAVWLDGGWSFRAPGEGWLAYVADSTEIAMFVGGAWMPLVTNGGSGVGSFGINTTADLTNRLSVAADASLFSHDGSSHRLKLNKATAGDSGSVLFQTGFSGRAEFGLTGDDDFHVKVSADGGAWLDAITIGASTARVSLAGGQLAFPATQNPSADAHTLDDYEEGTFTPTIASASGTITAYTASGSYTKVGRSGTWDIEVTISNNGTGSGDGILISGLPFTVSTWRGSGRELAITGKMLQVTESGGTAAKVWFYDNGYPGGNGTGFRIAGVFRV